MQAQQSPQKNLHDETDFLKKNNDVQVNNDLTNQYPIIYSSEIRLCNDVIERPAEKKSENSAPKRNDENKEKDRKEKSRPKSPSPSIPNVQACIKSLYRCKDNDINSACRAFRNLQLALRSEMFSCLITEHFPENNCFNPHEIFLSIQKNILRFHNASMEKRLGLKQLDSEKSGEEEETCDTPSWPIWKEALRALLFLSKYCIGPAWRWQSHQQKRRNSNSNGSHQSHQFPSKKTDIDSISTLGFKSTSSPIKRKKKSQRENNKSGCGATAEGTVSSEEYERLVENPVLSAMSFFNTNTNDENSDSKDIENGQLNYDMYLSYLHKNHQELLNYEKYPFIPLELPSLILNFALSAQSTVLPPLAHHQNFQSNDPKVSITCSLLSEERKYYIPDKDDITKIVEKKRKLLEQYQHLGQIQRDIVLSLCYGDQCNDVVPTITEHHPQQAQSIDTDGGKLHGESIPTDLVQQPSLGRAQSWEIPGAHTPISSMVTSWLNTALTTWPEQKAMSDILPIPVDENIEFSASANCYEVMGEEKVMEKASNNINEEVSSTQEKQGNKDEHIYKQNGITPAQYSTKEEGMALKQTNENEEKTKAKPDNAEVNRKIDIPWKDIAHLNHIDWLHTLQVSRAVTDLVSVGWRPSMMNNSSGPEVIIGLLTVIEKGLELDDQVLLTQTANNGAIISTEQVLSAISSTSEAMATLATLGSRGHLPLQSLYAVAKTVSCLLATEKAKTDDIVTDFNFNQDAMTLKMANAKMMNIPQVNDEKASDIVFFQSQRETCLSDAAELLWDLLVHPVSSVHTISISYQFIEHLLYCLQPLSNNDNDDKEEDDEKEEDYTICTKKIPDRELMDAILTASGVVRGIGAALWGNPPEVVGVQSLRLFWGETIDFFAASNLKVHECFKRQLLEFSEESIQPPQDLNKLNSLLALVLEIVVSMRRVSEGEMGGERLDRGTLTPYEWDGFITILDGLIVWLDDSGCKNYTNYMDNLPEDKLNTTKSKIIRCYLSNRKCIGNELRAIIIQIQHFLSVCASSFLHTSPSQESSHHDMNGNIQTPNSNNNTYTHHFIVDDTCRHRLHTILLESACPLLSPELSTSVAISVIHSCVSVGCLPHRGGSWCSLTSTLLKSIFAVYEDKTFSFYEGGFVHSPEVRHEALMALTYERDELIQSQSLFCLTMNVRELHLEFITSLLLPYLNLIIRDSQLKEESTKTENEDVNIAGILVEEVQTNVMPVSSKLKMMCGLLGDQKKYFHLEENKLKMLAVRLVGKLFRSVTGEGSLRVKLIEMLRNVALYETNVSSSKEGKVTKRMKGPKDYCEPKEHYPTTLRLEAIRQLELCLCAPFAHLPHTHGSVQIIIEALCEVISKFGDLFGENEQKNTSMESTNRLRLVLAALIPLARIRATYGSSRRRKARFLNRQLVTGPIIDKLEVLLPNRALVRGRPADKPRSLSREDSFGFFIENCDEKNLEQSATMSDGGNDDEEDFDEDQDAIYQYIFSLGEEEDDENNNETLTAPFLLLEDPSVISVNTTIQTTNISVYPIVTSICTALQGSMMSSKSTFDDEILDSESIHESEVLVSFIRTICFDTLDILFQSGVSLQNLCSSIISAISPRCNFISSFLVTEENRARSRAIASLSGYLSVQKFDPDFNYLMPEAVNLEKIDPKYQFSIESNSDFGVFGLLFQNCLSDDIVEANSACQAMGTIITLMKSIQKEIIQEIFVMIINRLDKFKDTPRDDDMPDWNIPFLSLLFDLLSENMLCDSATSTGIFTSCYKLCISTNDRQACLLALQCASLAITHMNKEELVIRSEKVISSCDEKYSEEAEKTVTILSDALSRQLHTLNTKGTQPTSCHYENMIESEEIRCFPVDSPSDSKEKVEAAWLFGDSILMLRLGNKMTRFRGWIEITLRSPTARIRRLVRLNSCSSVDTPEFPSSLWIDTTKRNAHSSFKKEENEQKQSSVLTKASAILERYDKLFHSEQDVIHHNNTSSNSLGRRRSANEETANDYIDSEEARTSTRSNEFSGKTNNLDRITTDTPNRPLHRRSYSADDINVNESEEPSKNTVHSWLESIIANSKENINKIEQELRDFGFSDTSLGIAMTSQEIQSKNVGENTKLQALSPGAKLQRAINILDRTTCLQTHKIGLMYDGRLQKPLKQSNEDEQEREEEEVENIDILSSTGGSLEFLQFSRDLGSLALNRHMKYFSGGLDTSSFAADGEFTLIHISDEQEEKKDSEHFSNHQTAGVAPRSLILFHSIPFMPTGINKRKRHVGNDYVHIVYCEQKFPHIQVNFDQNTDNSDDEASLGGVKIWERIGVVSGQFGFITIYVIPLYESYRVIVCLKKNLDKSVHRSLSHLSGSFIISKSSVASYVRLLSARADLASRSAMEDRIGFFSNWEERLVQIREMKRFVVL